MEIFKTEEARDPLLNSEVNIPLAQLSSISGSQSLSPETKRSRIEALQYDSSANELHICHELCGQINSLALTNDELRQLEDEIGYIRRDAEEQREQCIRNTSRCHYLTAFLLLGIPTMVLAISAVSGNRGATLAGHVADSSILGFFSSCGSCMMESIKRSELREIKCTAQTEINDYINNFIRQKQQSSQQEPRTY